MNIKTVCAVGALLALCSAANAGPVLDAVKARGQVVCGVNTAPPVLQVPTAKVSGPVLMSTPAALWLQPYSATLRR